MVPEILDYVIFWDDPLNFVKFKLAQAIVRKIIILTVGPPILYL